MFRVNRIGSPHQHGLTLTDSVAAWTGSATNSVAINTPGSVVNAAPDGTFAQLSVAWAGTPVTLGAGQKTALYHQFTVLAPVKGNVSGVEVQASLAIHCNKLPLLVGTFAKLTAAGGAFLANVNNASARHFRTLQQYNGQAPTAVYVAHYKEQFITYDATRLFGTYAHGMAIINNDAAGMTISGFHMDVAVRQLNDQTDVGYRDTRR